MLAPTPASPGHWLPGVRWAFLVVEALALLDSLPTPRWIWAAPIVLAQIALGFGLRRRLHAGSATLLAGVLAADVLAFTGLLAMAGAASNPFTVVFLVYIGVSVVALPRRFSWALVGLTVGGYAVLFVGHDPHMHHDMSKHLRGMWLGFAATASLMVWFGGRIHAQLVDARARAARGERLASLGALAASTAHELGTPLGTIAVASGEMLHAIDTAPRADLAADVRLIQGEVARCRAILDRLANDVGQARGEALQPVELTALLTPLSAAPEATDRLVIDGGPVTLHTFPTSLQRALRSLIDNALRAGPDPVRVVLAETATHALIEVIDAGEGMTEAVRVRATEPFFSTRDGEGLGLGLHLAQTIVEQLGGALTITSRRNQGTRVRIELPKGDR